MQEALTRRGGVLLQGHRFLHLRLPWGKWTKSVSVLRWYLCLVVFKGTNRSPLPPEAETPK